MTTRRGRPARQNRARSAIAALLALVLVASAAWARSLSDQEKATLAATVKSFDAAMRESDYRRIAQTVPPKVLAAIARRAGTTPDQVVAAMIKAMQQTLQSDVVRIESFGMDLAAASHKELPSGAPYVLIPTETVIAVRGGPRLRERSPTIALLDDGQWYLLRVNDAKQVQILREVYPEFAGVELLPGSTETLKP